MMGFGRIGQLENSARAIVHASNALSTGKLAPDNLLFDCHFSYMTYEASYSVAKQDRHDGRLTAGFAAGQGTSRSRGFGWRERRWSITIMPINDQSESHFQGRYTWSRRSQTLRRNSPVLLGRRRRRSVHLASVYSNMSQSESGSVRHATRVDPTPRRPNELSRALGITMIGVR